MQAEVTRKKSDRKTSEGPSHVLFAVLPKKTQPTVDNDTIDKKRVCCDPRLDADYVSKRQRAHEPFVGWNKPTTTTNSPWQGISVVEQDLVGCCESLPEDYYESDEDEVTDDAENDATMLPANPLGGVLAIEHEARFAAILAKSCQSMASRCLVMAILERTLEAYLEEQAKAREEKEKAETTEEKTKDNATETTRNRRFRLFFAAGGLRILNQWLVEASSYEPIQNKSKTSNVQAHSTRPIALSILLFLEHIPFDKKTVTNSKINKQIQKLGKKLAMIQEAHQKKTATREDLDLWLTNSSEKDKNKDEQALTRIVTAVDAVKASWREKAKGEKKQQSQPQANPFGDLQSKIRERLQEWKQFEAREQTPDWYRPIEKKASPKRKAPPEQQRLRDKIQQMQSRNQTSLQQLREKLRRQTASSNNNNNNNRKVAWKDGLKTQQARNRQVLEQVKIFGTELPPASVGTDSSS